MQARVRARGETHGEARARARGREGIRFTGRRRARVRRYTVADTTRDDSPSSRSSSITRAVVAALGAPRPRPASPRPSTTGTTRDPAHRVPTALPAMPSGTITPPPPIDNNSLLYLTMLKASSFFIELAATLSGGKFISN